MKSNEWLESKKFLSECQFHDEYYFEKLCKHISNFLKSIPINAVTSWDPINKRIYFLVGKNKKFFEVTTDVSYYDYLHLCRMWLLQFFPKYEIETEMKIELSDEEIWSKVKKENIKLDDALLLRKKKKQTEFGIIEKIMLKNDEFVFRCDGNRFIRMSGNINNPFPLSSFLKNLRQISKDEEIKKHIEENSIIIIKLSNRDKEIFIDYEGKQMVNFFIINYFDLKDKKFLKTKEKEYQWGRFRIKFNSNLVLKDCLSFLNKKGFSI